MDEQAMTQMTEAAARLASAAEALQKALGRIEAQQEEIGARVARIVAAIEERTAEESGATSDSGSTELQARVAELERENAELTAQAGRRLRKTLSPLAATLLTKSGMEDGARVEEGLLDKALASLSLEQRIAVKAEMARAGMIE